MKYYYIYKITCTAGYLKDKFYFGKRITSTLPENDKYKGSGVIIQKYYKKHPNDYVKEIISFHNSKTELNKAEYDIIHPYLGNEMCLNLMEGGLGGAQYFTSEETRKKQSQSHKGKKPWNKGISWHKKTKRKMSEEEKQKRKGQIPWNKGLKGCYSPETRKKQSESAKKHESNFKGKHHSEDSNNKNRLSHFGKGHPQNDQTKKKISNGNKGEKNGMCGKIPWNKGLKMK